VTEASELLEIFRYRDAGEIDHISSDGTERVRVADELADALFCLLRFAEKNGFDLSESLRAKLVKTAIKYPRHQ
jgi:NTP pyrophosphatase (non-canonical NTP hydrolase)